MTVHQWTAALAPNAAATNDALALQAQLGGASSLLASGIVPGDAGLVAVCTPTSELATIADADVVLAHVGVVAPSVEAPLLRELACVLASRPRVRVVLRVHRTSAIAGVVDELRAVAVLCTTHTQAAWVEARVDARVAARVAARVGVHTGGRLRIGVASPLLPLEPFAAIDRSRAVDGGGVLVDAAVEAGDGIERALVRVHCMRAHRLVTATFTHTGAVHDVARFEGLARVGASLRLHRRWLGAPAHAAVVDAYATAAVLCDLSDGDAFPAAAMQALAAGLPVVARASDARLEVLGGAALLVDDGDDGLVMCEALAAVCEDAALAHRLAAAGRERAGQHLAVRAAAAACAFLEAV